MMTPRCLLRVFCIVSMSAPFASSAYDATGQWSITRRLTSDPCEVGWASPLVMPCGISQSGDRFDGYRVDDGEVDHFSGTITGDVYSFEESFAGGDITTRWTFQLTSSTELSGTKRATVHLDNGTPCTLRFTITGHRTDVPPEITSSPASKTVSPGRSATFSVSVRGSGPFRFQWRRNGAAIPGAVSLSYTIASASEEDAGVYSCEIGNDLGSVTSDSATLTVGASPTIAAQPRVQVVNAGESATFSVAALGSAPLGYQWRKDGVDLHGETSATLSITAAVNADEGIYSCTVRNGHGSIVSDGAELSVFDPAMGEKTVSEELARAKVWAAENPEAVTVLESWVHGVGLFFTVKAIVEYGTVFAAPIGMLDLILEGLEVALSHSVFGVLRDPPDPEYDVALSVQPPALPVPANDGTVPNNVYVAWLRCLESTNHLAVYARAVLAAEEKRQGALAAGDDAWAAFHAGHLSQWVPKLEELFGELEQRKAELLAAVRASDLSWRVIDDSDIDTAKASVMSDGLPAIEQDVLGLHGYEPGSAAYQGIVDTHLGVANERVPRDIEGALTRGMEISRHFASLFSLPEPTAVTLEPGWNLLSIARQPEENSVQAMLGSHVPSPVWVWSKGRYRMANELLPLRGHWVYYSGTEPVEIIVDWGVDLTVP